MQKEKCILCLETFKDDEERTNGACCMRISMHTLCSDSYKLNKGSQCMICDRRPIDSDEEDREDEERSEQSEQSEHSEHSDSRSDHNSSDEEEEEEDEEEEDEPDDVPLS